MSATDAFLDGDTPRPPLFGSPDEPPLGSEGERAPRSGPTTPSVARRRLVPSEESDELEDIARPARVPRASREPREPRGPKEARVPRLRRERGDSARKARRVRRVLRQVDPWSVLKLSLLFYACLFVVVMVAGTVLWNLASSTGVIGDIEGFIKDVGAYKSFAFKGSVIFRASLLIGMILVIAGAAFNVLLVVLFNLISDLVGGVRLTVLEEEHRAAPSSAPG